MMCIVKSTIKSIQNRNTKIITLFGTYEFYLIIYYNYYITKFIKIVKIK